MFELTNQLNCSGVRREEEDAETKLLFTQRKKKKGVCNRFFCCFCKMFKRINKTDKRLIYLNERNETFYKNIIRNQKYNVITFIPFVLFHQFTLFSNQFYLLMAISQFFDALKVGFFISYVAPLVFVLVITLSKEGLDDYNRYCRDTEANNQKFLKLTKRGKEEIRSADIRIGDILEINQNERLPADMIVLKSYNDESGSLFIRTDQLDGETDWKLRKAPNYTQKIENLDHLLDLRGVLLIEPPSRNIYSFVGVFNVLIDSTIIKEPLGLENTMWSNTVLASKKVLGVVIYTGKETRAQMNSSLPRSKIGMLDLELNKLNKILFIVMLFSSLIIVIIKGFSIDILSNFISFFRFVVLLCSIIPISLRVNLDISKTYNSHIISTESTIPETIVRNSTIPEELGRIQYIFSDKTGTLTKNEMIFKKLALETDLFTDDNVSDLKMIIEDECKVCEAPALDIVNKSEISGKRIRRNRNKVVRDAISAMALCHNVTPTYLENGEIFFQASSPDEVALVQTASKLGLSLTHRTDKEIRITNSNNDDEIYDILAIFPFTSESKRMGIILRNRKHNHIIFYLKGAENVMERFVREEYKSHIKENAETLASTGLRTLVLTQKVLDKEYFESWLQKFNSAHLEMENRNEKIRAVIDLLENSMEFLAVSGVEDLLQDEVADTIDALRNAGIKIWMLTGDKIETATCISISTGIKTHNNKLFFIRDQCNREIIKEKLLSFKDTEDSVLIIDGECLEVCLKHLEEEFFIVSLKAPAVVCCRCSPTQKANIVRAVRKYTNKRICAIGDGGNDVSMIQESHVGLGLLGKEGMQASLAADYSLTKFKHLKVLILWFGRVSYKNTSTIAKFVIHRGLIISFIQFIFSILFYCSAIPIYNGNLIMGYTTIYTALPVICLLLDRDARFEHVIFFPPLYKDIQKGRELSIKAFLFWFNKSIFQATVIMIGSLFLFDSLFLKIVTITFTVLIFSELLNVYTEIINFHKYMIFSLVGTLLTYILSLVFLRTVLDVYYIFNLEIISKILILTFISWFPFFFYAKLRAKLFPQTHEKLSKLNK